MKVLKVIVDRMPEGCGYCKFVNICTPGKGTDWEECEIYYCEITGEEVINDTRPDWCPIMTTKNYYADLVKAAIELYENTQKESEE